jgi:hypothetical protein
MATAVPLDNLPTYRLLINFIDEEWRLLGCYALWLL